MLTIISPSQSLDFETPAPLPQASQAQFLSEAAQLMGHLQALPQADLMDLMNLSPALAEENITRFAQWQKKHTLPKAKQALFAFTGCETSISSRITVIRPEKSRPE